MQTLSDYFSYNTDYYDINKIFYDLSKKMKTIHNDGMVISNLSGSSIIYDNSFEFANKQAPYDFDLQRKEDNIRFSKLLLGTYLSLSSGFRDFSSIPTEWFVENIADICSSINVSYFFADYFYSIFSNGSDEYYCDFLDRKKQEAGLRGSEKTASYKKVLTNSASAFYQSDYDDNQSDLFDSNNKSALVNELFYPILFFSLLVVVLSLLFVFCN